MNQIPAEFATAPIVYAVGSSYQIIVPVTCETVMWVRVGERCFYDDSNGILRSGNSTHKMTVPASLLNAAKAYTVCYRRINERRPYFTDAGELMEYTSSFRPVESSPVRIYHISDAHNEVEKTTAAGSFFGDTLDLLVLNGDIPNHSGKIKYLTTIHEIAARLTGGQIPVVFSRGNHDTRGIFAEKIEEHTPTDNGRSYYTFRVGQVWGLVLDCGEDKPDGNCEYGHTICCEDFRKRESDFIRDVIARAGEEYAAPGVCNRLVICHVPFTEKFKSPFDIEEDTYREWCRLLREHIHPQVMLCGHMHNTYVSRVGCMRDDKGQPCDVVVGSKPQGEDAPFIGTALTLYADRCTVQFTDSNRCVTGEDALLFPENK